MMLQARPSFLLMAQAVDDVVQAKPRLDRLETQGVNCVLHHTICKLSIIHPCCGFPKSKDAWANKYCSMASRMTKPQKLKAAETDTTNHSLLLKMKKDMCSFIQLILEETMQELYFHGTKYYLEYALYIENLKSYDAIALRSEYYNRNENIKMLNDQYFKVRNNFQETLFYLSGNIMEPCLRKAVVSNWATLQTVKKHTDISLKTRIQGVADVFKDKENNIIGLTNICNKEIQESNSINVEIENQLLAMISSLNKSLEVWTERYNTEIESLDVTLLQIKSRVQVQQEQYSQLLDTCKTRQELVCLLRIESYARDAELELKRLQNRAASIIQSWWRAIKLMKFIRAHIKNKGTSKTNTKSNKK